MRYMGGKSRIAKQLIEVWEPFLAQSAGYIEPFLGGGSVMSHVQHTNRIGSDSHVALMNMWKAIKQGWELPKHNVTKAEYLRLKAEQDPKDPMTAFVGFGLCFGGKYFASFTVGECNYASHAHASIKRLNIKTIKLMTRDYEAYSPEEYKNYVIYCDPPYENTMPYKGTRAFDYDRFYQWARLVSSHNKVFISSYAAPADFIPVLEINVPLHMGHYKKRTTEKLFCYERYWPQWELERLLILYKRGLTSSP